MVKLTDEQLTYWEQQTDSDANLKATIMAMLIAEVREGRRMVKVVADIEDGLALCPADGCEEWVQEGNKFCSECGVRLQWKE